MISAGAVLGRAATASGSLRLQSDDHLALLLIGYARDGFRGLRVPADIVALRAAGRRLDPARVPDALREPLVAAALAVGELLGVCPIDPVDPRIARRRRLRAALALWDPLLRLEGTKSWADVALTDLLLAPPSGARRGASPAPVAAACHHPGARTPGGASSSRAASRAPRADDPRLCDRRAAGRASYAGPER